MIVEAKSDREKGLLVDHYKSVILRAHKESDASFSSATMFKNHIKMMFEYHFNTDKE